LNLELPASSLAIPSLGSNSLQTGVYPIKVLETDRNVVTISSQTPLQKGQIVDFKEGVSGIVISTTQVLLRVKTLVTEGRVRLFMKLPPAKPEFLVPSSALGILRVKVVASKSMPDFCLGWGFETPNGLAVVGNDSAAPSFASFKGNGVFSPGRYTLRVTRYMKINLGLQPISTVERTWEIKESVGSILAGDYYDDSPPILL
jgi:hypothetical protein